MKKIISFSLACILAIVFFATSVSAYQPLHDQMGDVRWFGGYNPDSGLVTLSDVDKGVRVKFKHEQIIWAMRAVAGWDYNLSATDSLKAGVKPDEEGIYVRLEDIKWDVPSGTPKNPNPSTSVMIAISEGQGSWSDSPGVMFWIRKNKSGNQVAILRGQDASKPQVDQFAMAQIDLKEPLGNNIDFYIRKTSATKWTCSINGNSFTFDHSIFTERFPALNPLAVNVGTWTSDAGVEYTISELWGYGVIEYGKKVGGNYQISPKPDYVVNAQKAPVATTTPGKVTTTQPANNATGETTADPSETEVDPSETQDTTDTNPSEDNETTNDITQVNGTTTTIKGKANKGGSPLVGIIIAIIVIVLAGGGVAFYFLFIKNKDQLEEDGLEDGEDVPEGGSDQPDNTDEQE